MADRGDEEAKIIAAEMIETAGLSTTSVPCSHTDSHEPLQINEHAHLTLKESLVKWRRVVVYSLCMTSAILMYGYDYAVVGTVSAMPSFQ